MPIYEYICEQCQERHEIMQKFNEDAPLVCPACRAKGSMKKAITAPAFHLKGGGWYKDLYASKKPSDDKPSKTSDTKSDTVAKKPNND